MGYFGTGSAPDRFVVPESAFQPGPAERFTGARTTSTPRLAGGEKTGVFIVAGQSNAQNIAAGAYAPANGAKIDNLNLYDGGTYRALEPLLGADTSTAAGFGPGNMFLRVADKLISAGIFARVILATVAKGGTTIAEWDATLHRRILVAHRRLAAVGLAPTAVLWQQGESDTNAGTTQSAYTASAQSMINKVRAEMGTTVPWFLAYSTYYNGVTSPGIREAVAALIAANPNVYAGADTDTLTGTAVNRNAADGVHLTAAGQDTGAGLWGDALHLVF